MSFSIIGQAAGGSGGTTLQAVFLSFFLVFYVSRWLAYRRGLQAVGHIPVVPSLFHPMSVPGAFLPTTWWNPGFHFIWKWRNKIYKQYQTDTVSFVPFLLGAPTIYTANLDVARQITSDSGSKKFQKAESAMKALLEWGMNLVTSSGDVWRKHKRVMSPAFNNKLYEVVWNDTLLTYYGMIAGEGWSDNYKDRIEVPEVQKLTFKVALLVIMKCGFGFPFNWTESARTSDGRMALQEAFTLIADSTLIALFLPRWIRKLPFKRFRELSEAEKEVMGFMRKQITEHKLDIHAPTSGLETHYRTNMFTMLVEASEKEEPKRKLSDSELIGNVFIMLIAGHETTANSLAATLAFLAADKGLQDELHEHILSVVGDRRDPLYSDYSKLNKVLAVFVEATRMYPAGYVLAREAAEDTTLIVPNKLGEEGSQTVHIPKGTEVYVDVIGLQYNPRYHDQPNKFLPSRWYDVSFESDAFTAFSMGPRTCIGRRFATTEAVCFLTMLLRDFRIEPLLTGKETISQWKERVFDATLTLSLGINHVPVTFIRRKQE